MNSRFSMAVLTLGSSESDGDGNVNAADKRLLVSPSATPRQIYREQVRILREHHDAAAASGDVRTEIEGRWAVSAGCWRSSYRRKERRHCCAERHLQFLAAVQSVPPRPLPRTARKGLFC